MRTGRLRESAPQRRDHVLAWTGRDHVCQVCRQSWRKAPRSACRGVRTYSRFGQPSDLLTSYELAWLGLERPAERAGVLVKGSREWDLFSACVAAPEATPEERRRIATVTRLNRQCQGCLWVNQERVNKRGPYLCTSCASGDPTPFTNSGLWLPTVSPKSIERPGELSAILQLAEFEARAVLERAGAARVMEQLELLQTGAEGYAIERVDLVYRTRTAGAAELVAEVSAWRETLGVPALDQVDGAVVAQALAQALERLDQRDEMPFSPMTGTWLWGHYVRWIHSMVAQFYGGHRFENGVDIDAARVDLGERIALLWWYVEASGALAREWLVVPTEGWAVKEITSVGGP